MYCPQCMKKIPRTASTCPFCSQPTHTPVAGMATLRVSCRPHLPLWVMILQPLNYFRGYKVHISVDEQNYVLKSKKKQIDIPVSIGTHQVRVAGVSKKSAVLLKWLGTVMVVGGAANGDGSTVYTGAALEDLGAAFSEMGVPMSFEANELLSIPVMLSWNGALIEDKKE